MFLFLWCVVLCVLLSITFRCTRNLYFSHEQKLNVDKLSVVTTTVMVLGLIFSTVIGALTMNFICPEYKLLLGLLLILSLLYMENKTVTNFRRIIFDLLLCAVGVFALLQPYPDEIQGYWLWGTILSILWFCGWRLFRFLDRYPMMSMVVSTGWMIAIIVGMVIVSGYSNISFILGLVLGLMVFMILRNYSALNFMVLGHPIASLVGFIWAGVWISLLRVGELGPYLIIYSYFLMEFIPLVYYTWKNRPYLPLFIRALQVPKTGKNAVRFLFTHIILLGCVAIMVGFTYRSFSGWVLLVLMAIILLDLYQKLSHIGSPLLGWKQLFLNLKTDLKSISLKPCQQVIPKKGKAASPKNNHRKGRKHK